MKNESWLLPEGVEEFLPYEAKALENLRRRLLNLFDSWGYDLVIPPMVEYIESLLTGTGNDLDLQTYKLIDQNNGRTMGVRADMTPQVARIDAHKLSTDSPTRLCYIGTVLHTRSSDFSHARSIKQIGAELYGHGGDESDVEIINLMLATLSTVGVEEIHLDLGHVGIYRNLIQQSGIDAEQEDLLFDAIQRKSSSDIEQILNELNLSGDIASMLNSLSTLHGGSDVIATARDKLQHAHKSVHQAINSLQTIVKQISQLHPDVQIHLDMAELRGYHYHTGVVYSAYIASHAQAIAQGGRYDNIGEAFGRARPATGFSADLRSLTKMDKFNVSNDNAIFASAPQDEAQLAVVNSLRDSGERVVCELPNQNGSAENMGCNRKLIKSQDGDWIVEAVGKV